MIPIRSGAMSGALITFFPSCPDSRLARRAVTDCLIASAANNQMDHDSLIHLAEHHHREDPDR
jgi:hypothetical protein